MKALMKCKDEGKENPLIGRPDLREAAFSHFSRMSYNEASLNAILQEANINKGSFYFKFYDKMDLYLCLMEQVAQDKVKYLNTRTESIEESEDIFSKLKQIALATMDYAAKEPRANLLGRNFLSENEEIKKIVKTAFPVLNEDVFGALVDSAIEKGQLTDKYNRDFIYAVVNLHFSNMDVFIKPNMTTDEILAQVDSVIGLLKDSIGI